jgi:hypothetical protein
MNLFNLFSSSSKQEEDFHDIYQRFLKDQLILLSQQSKENKLGAEVAVNIKFSIHIATLCDQHNEPIDVILEKMNEIIKDTIKHNQKTFIDMGVISKIIINTDQEII